MITKKYQLINNLGGWIVFIIALVTYWLTLEPTASYWDCGEFIIQADKLEVGHPPGNPIFMLTARFFANFASSPETVSVMVNAMSGLLSALTILLLFWTISHLVRRLTVRDNQDGELSVAQYVAIMGSAAVGSLAYCWSDTFWFSAVEGEVYAFSSFCTALVFWLILKWENRADQPGSDRWLILIAYIIGVSVAVHLLNLLCIPAIVLVFAYRKYKNMDLVKSLVALLVSFAIIFFVLYGLVPGFIKLAQRFELFFVNTCGMSFNSGALIYAFTMLAVLVWTLYEYYSRRSRGALIASTILSVTLSGMLFIGSGWWIGWLLEAAMAALLIVYKKRLPLRWLNLAVWSIAVIFAGYSSYALILIRSSADTPMNQNSPDNVFDLASYLNREQYGETPLLYGRTLYSSPVKEYQGVRSDTLGVGEEGTPIVLNTPQYSQKTAYGAPQYGKGVKGAHTQGSSVGLTDGDTRRNMDLAARGGDYYVKKGYKDERPMNPELNMLFPRIYSSMHAAAYGEWVNLDTVPGQLVELQAYDPMTDSWVPEFDTQSEPSVTAAGTIAYPVKTAYKPTFSQNLSYFFNYQLNHMYMRYFMWNFAGRQNDLLNQHGELDAGNWISGIPAIDNPRLGDQSLLPDDLGKNNAGHNTYYMLPLFLGILGLLWQAFAGRRGIEQFWVVFFLFFMTGIAIVLYLNQPPQQPRERDYAFAGSFYAYAIWIGMGVAALWRIGMWLVRRKQGAGAPKGEGAASDVTKAPADVAKSVDDDPLQPLSIVDEPKRLSRPSAVCAIAGAVLGVLVPIQMVSQTWDDHDRSGRYAARDFGANYLESLEPNAIVFCNGDNETFPLWYAQEVEGVRPDVKIINLSYLSSDWYANQQRLPSYTAKPVKMSIQPQEYAYGALDAVLINPNGKTVPLEQVIKDVRSGKGRDQYGYPVIEASKVSIPVDRATVLKRGLVAPEDTARIVDTIEIDLANAPAVRGKGYVSLSELLMLDIISTNARNGWERPVYWCSTVGPEYHLGLTPYLRAVGMTHQLVPAIREGMPARADRAYDVVTKKYRWGGADAPEGRTPYFDETASRMLTTMRGTMIDLAQELILRGDAAREQKEEARAKDFYAKARTVLNLLGTKLPERTAPFGISIGYNFARLQLELGQRTGDKKLTRQGLAAVRRMMDLYAQYVVYNQTVAAQFIAPSLSIESQIIPYQFYDLVELYRQFGGNVKQVEASLKKQGVNLDQLRKNNDAYNGRGAGTGGEGGADDNIATIVQFAEISTEMSKLSPEEYAKRSAEERLYDSMFYPLYEAAVQNGYVKQEELMKHEQFKNVDLGRAKRLGDEYLSKHPEQTGK